MDTLAEAIKQGYMIYERVEYGYLARKKTSEGWIQALIRIKKDDPNELSPGAQ